MDDVHRTHWYTLDKADRAITPVVTRVLEFRYFTHAGGTPIRIPLTLDEMKDLRDGLIAAITLDTSGLSGPRIGGSWRAAQAHMDAMEDRARWLETQARIIRGAKPPQTYEEALRAAGGTDPTEERIRALEELVKVQSARIDHLDTELAKRGKRR